MPAHSRLIAQPSQESRTPHARRSNSPAVAFYSGPPSWPAPTPARQLGAPRAELVGVPGFEPGTSSLSGTRSNQLSYTPNSFQDEKNGGGNRVRTGDPELAKLVLYQLSYAPDYNPGPRFTVQTLLESFTDNHPTLDPEMV